MTKFENPKSEQKTKVVNKKNALSPALTFFLSPNSGQTLSYALDLVNNYFRFSFACV